jgi:hypothetical protein
MPSISHVNLKLNFMKNYASDILIIILISLAYSFLSGKTYPESFGFAIGGGFIGFILYKLIINFFLAKKIALKQSVLRQYTIGTLMFSFIGIPAFISQGSQDKEQTNSEYDISYSFGQILGACEAANYIKNRYCEKLEISKDFKASCDNNLSNLVPEKLKNKINEVINLSGLDVSMSQLHAKIDKDFTSINSNVTVDNLCNHYQKTLDYTYKISKEKVTAVSYNMN